jgi:DNA repair photolyase
VRRTVGTDLPINGQVVRSDGRWRVEAIEDLGIDIPMYDITTGTGDFVANGVISHNCFARPTHEYLGFDIGGDFDSKIVVKVNAVELARAETAPGRWAGHPIAMGTNTDPYQPAEGKYQLTRGIVEVLTERANPFSILTKSSLVVRDLDVLAEAAARMRISVDFSIGTLDEEVWKLTEPGTPHPRRRIEAVRRLTKAGVPSGILMAPVLPGLSDRIEQLEAVVVAGLDAGARFISPMYLHMRGTVRDHYMDWLNGARPDLVSRYEQGYRPSGNAPPKAAAWLSERVEELIDKHGGIRARRIERSEMAGRPDTDRPQQLGFDF